MDDEARLAAIEIALSQAKRVQRESRHVVQALARLRDDIDETLNDTALEGTEDGNSNKSRN